MEYWREADRVRQRLELLRQTVPPVDQEETLLLQRRMRILYDMYLDCVHTAKYLERRARQRGEC
ncbi:MAG: hypothetical protein ACOYJZ_02445 [Acutalibacter sp.]